VVIAISGRLFWTVQSEDDLLKMISKVGEILLRSSGGIAIDAFEATDRIGGGEGRGTFNYLGLHLLCHSRIVWHIYTWSLPRFMQPYCCYLLPSSRWRPKRSDALPLGHAIHDLTLARNS